MKGGARAKPPQEYMNGILRRHDHIGVHTKPLNGVSIRKKRKLRGLFTIHRQKMYNSHE